MTTHPALTAYQLHLPDDLRIFHYGAPPIAETRLRAGDGLLLVGGPASLERTTALLGREQPGLLSLSPR